MNVPTMRAADRLLGVPACAALTGWRWLAGDRPPAGPIRRLLFVKLAEQGATVLAVPAIRRAVALVGRENVFLLVFAENRFILDVLDLVPPANVVTIPTTGPLALAAGAWRALWQLRRLRLDAAVDLEFFARASAVLAYLSGAHRRAGYHRYSTEGPWRGDLLTHPLSFNPGQHAVQAFDSLVQALTVAPEQLPALPFAPVSAVPELPRFAPPAAEVAAVRELLQAAGLPAAATPLILLNANAGDLLPLRRWPTDRYVELARRLLADRPAAAVVFTGAPAEAAAVAPLVQAVGSPRCLGLAGRTTLRQLLVLYTLADVLVTNDSGPAHFASLTPVEVVTLFGPESPAIFGAQTPRSQLLAAGLACSPCVHAFNNRLSFCRHNLCLQAITVEQVCAAVHTALARRAPAPPAPPGAA